MKLVFCVVIFIGVAAIQATADDTNDGEQDVFPDYWENDNENFYDYSEENNHGEVQTNEKEDYIDDQVEDEIMDFIKSTSKKDISSHEDFDALLDYQFEDNRSNNDDKEDVIKNNVNETSPEELKTKSDGLAAERENNLGQSNKDKNSKELNAWSGEEDEDAPFAVPDTSVELSKEVPEKTNDEIDNDEEPSDKLVKAEYEYSDLDQILEEISKSSLTSTDLDLNDDKERKTKNDEVSEDLSTDLDLLFETLNKLSANDTDLDDIEDIVSNSKEVDDIKDYEDKYDRPYGEGYILSLRDDYENYFNSNLSEIFAENMNKSFNNVEQYETNDDVEQEIPDNSSDHAVTLKTEEQRGETTNFMRENEKTKTNLNDYSSEIDYDALLLSNEEKDKSEDIKHYYGNDGLVDDEMPKNEDAEVFLSSSLAPNTESYLPASVSYQAPIEGEDTSSARDLSTAAMEDVTMTTTIEEVDSTTAEDEKKVTLMVDDLNSSQYNDLMSQFIMTHTEDLDVHSKPVNVLNTRHITLSLDEPTVITSPNYPQAYPLNTVIDWIIEGPGMGIEMNLTDCQLNGVAGDYLLVKPGGVDASGTDGLVFTYRLTSEKRYRFTNVNTMFVRFESRDRFPLRGFSLSARMVWPPFELEEEKAPEPEPILHSPTETLKLNLAGITLMDFHMNRTEFKQLIADMAQEYIMDNGIDPGLNTTLEVTQITRAAVCNIRWPNYETCVEVTFGVPLHYEEEVDSPRLTTEDLDDMWKTYIVKEPFASRLSKMGITEYAIPNDRSVLMVWLAIAAGVVVAMALLGFALWRFSCFEDYTRMKTFNDSDSIQNEKRNLDLYPTPHQTLPPLYSDTDYKWADDDSARVDMGGFANKSYIRDDLFDLDSDEDIITTRDRKGVIISSKDVYDA